MSAVGTIPLTVAPEAAARVAELGMQAEFQKMLDHIPQVVPGLCRIEVTLWVPEDFDDDPRVTIEAAAAAPTFCSRQSSTPGAIGLSRRFRPTSGDIS
jgi:hypothetical protein